MEKPNYTEFAENKISAIIFENRNILNHKVDFDSDINILNITLFYQGFTVLMKFGRDITEGYSFVENTNTDRALITKFEFPFSKIPYSIYDVHNTVSDPVFCTYDFHCLYGDKSIDSAFDTVIEFINRNEKIISEINGNAQLRKKLEDSFENGLRVASKKITPEMIDENPDKYLHKHDLNLYFLRSAETAFTDFVNGKKTKTLQKFYISHHKKNNLLTYEERYLDYLYENDFNLTNEDFVEEVEKREKSSSHINGKESVTTLISLIISFAVNLLLGILTEHKLEESYFLLKEITIDSIIPLLISAVFMTLVLRFPVDYIFSKRNKESGISFTGNDKKAYAVTAVIGIVLFAVTNCFVYFDYQKNVGLGENNIYYCQEYGKAEILEYDEIKLYLIEGNYYGDEYSNYDEDKRIAVVKNDDYENYFISDYLTEIEMRGSYRDSLDYAGKFSSLDDFCAEFGI